MNESKQESKVEKPSELDVLLTDYKAALHVLSLSPEDVPMANRAGFQMRKNEAIEKMPKLRTSYSEALNKVSFGLALVGSEVDKFVELAVQEAEVVVVDGEALYSRLADPIWAGIGNSKNFGVDQYSATIHVLRDIGAELGLVSFPTPKWIESVSVHNKEELVKHLRSMIESSLGTEFVGMYVKKQICEAALTSYTDGKVVPILVKTAGVSVASLMSKLFMDNRWMTVQATNVTKESVLQTFEAVKKQLKKKS
jgi:hypothetical protein